MSAHPEDPGPMTLDDVSAISNTRVRRLLKSALGHGLEIYMARNVERCWTISKQRYGSESLTVYGEANNAAHVSYDSGRGRWLEDVTQVRALAIMQEMALT
ncbi:hypothetical protein MA6G0728R_5425 [Mycobacteroides abscessus 6G-0728-R]|nr:hypothetical protein MA6G0125S_5336 [Mycobacteroides abscessus 6G-0125-S]EIU64257.1 hypothetical protein MA6G0728S_5398 [Mycobacteroides abscessus 6G-0728-S]EIU74716.1 hypothetical protein MA6G1108_5340 [Mycobacteroides abscessus 6G-1108]EIV03121.1 hypothetical protein MA6G0728R_5425 [Mycobacteroides abscessus 6G-0728-R]